MNKKTALLFKKNETLFLSSRQPIKNFNGKHATSNVLHPIPHKTGLKNEAYNCGAL